MLICICILKKGYPLGFVTYIFGFCRSRFHGTRPVCWTRSCWPVVRWLTSTCRHGPWSSVSTVTRGSHSDSSPPSPLWNSSTSSGSSVLTLSRENMLVDTIIKTYNSLFFYRAEKIYKIHFGCHNSNIYVLQIWKLMVKYLENKELFSDW